MIRLTLVCSAATAATRRQAFPDDEPIEERAGEHAHALRQRLDARSRAIRGPSLRARQTAEALGLQPTIEPALDDLALGRWRGRRLQEVETEAPEQLAAWRADPGAAPHGGESLLDLQARVEAWLAAIAASRGGVVAVTHAAVIRVAVLQAIGAPVAGFWRVDVPPLADVVLTSFDGRWNLRLGAEPPTRRDGVARPGATGQDAGTRNEGG